MTARLLLATLRTFGPAPTLRAGKLLSAAEKLHPTEEHWYLDLLATDPHYQRQGLASALLAPALLRCDDEGRPAYLETTKPENVGFYRSHGFEVLQEIVPVPGAPHAWLMWREPR